MDNLPIELVYRILSLLEYRPLASAARVCRTWRHLTDHAELWKTLYERRWGRTKEPTAHFKNNTSPASESWKTAYEIQDRWDRIGEDMTIIREGDDYFLAQKGRLLRFLGTCSSDKTKVVDQAQRAVVGKSTNDGSTGTSTTTTVAESTMATGERFHSGGKRSFNPGLLDKMIRFVGDLDHEHRRLSKRAHLTST
ncbi:hypothetical protein R1sor_002264 [Riccia sorocarpa]|uniref:F-box domain-containing protein n=1 Tax=Riccia sorocarpa TaxID=122646 RepID=A0ABD3GYA9_9MARC